MDSAVIDWDASQRRRKVATVASPPRTDAILNMVRAQTVLRLLPERDLLAVMRQSSTKSLPKNRVMFRAGDEGHAVVLILQGYVKLSTMASNGREVVLEIAGPGALFGEIAVLNDRPRQADATTLTSCRVMAIDGGLFRRLLADTPAAMFAAIGMVAERLSAITAREMDAVSLPAPVRLAKALLHLAKLHSERVEDGVQIGFRLSQRELGAMTGLIRESINKHLKAWRAAGWVELSDGTLTLRDVRALQDFVHGSEAS